MQYSAAGGRKDKDQMPKREEGKNPETGGSISRQDLTPMPELLTVDEAGALLRKSRNTMYRYLREGRINAYQVAGGGRLLFKKEELFALLTPVDVNTLKVNEDSDSEGRESK